MRKIVYVFLALTILTSCVKEDDESNQQCTKECTKVTGKVFTSGNEPLENIPIKVTYKETAFLYYKGKIKAKTKSNNKGIFNMSFHMKDDELKALNNYNPEGPSFSTDILADFNHLDPNRYILRENIYSTNDGYDTTRICNQSFLAKKDTTFNFSFYIPKKALATITLTNFTPILEDDYFAVTTLYPFGIDNFKNYENDNIVHSSYQYFEHGYWKEFIANGEETIFKLPVAIQDTNIVRIEKKKNGIVSKQDYKIYISKDKNIELSYEY